MQAVILSGWCEETIISHRIWTVIVSSSGEEISSVVIFWIIRQHLGDQESTLKALRYEMESLAEEERPDHPATSG